MKKLDTWIRKKVKQKIFSREPHPVLPFVLFVLILLFAVYFYGLDINICFKTATIVLAIFTFFFAIAHWYVWSVSRVSKK